MTDDPQRVIAWFRRDLRIADNRMLAAATAAGRRVFPVFVADPARLDRHARAAPRLSWFAASLDALDERLRAHGSGLVVLHGEPAEVLRTFAAEVGAESVFAARDEDPHAAARDRRVASAVNLRLVDDQRLVAPGELLSTAGEPFRVFTPFRRALDRRIEEDGDALAAEARADRGRLAPHPGTVKNAGEFPAGAPPVPLPDAGEGPASERLRAFSREDLRGYRRERDRPDLDSTSRLSPHLRVGSLSVRAAWRAALDAEREGSLAGDTELRDSARRWRDELAWREFHAAVLDANPRIADESLRPEYGAISWEEGPEADAALDAWHHGQTGYPIVDAGMRQLRATGWMHNRLRLITASFLVKDLGIDWRRGEAVFMEHLLDGDLAQNAGNWQWVAGVGTDAAPYFRVFNPVLQGRRFDPHGTFVRTWLPELDGVHEQHLHEPWQAPPERRPRSYPEPIVDHGSARRRALDRYASARAG